MNDTGQRFSARTYDGQTDSAGRVNYAQTPSFRLGLDLSYSKLLIICCIGLTVCCTACSGVRWLS